MTRWITGGLLLLSTACTPPPATQGVASSLDARVVVHTDGNLDVTETMVVESDASGGVAFDRVVRSARADAVTFESFSIDGVPVAADRAGLSVQPAGGAGIHVSWRPERRRGPATITLAYRVDRAVGVNQPRGRLEWPLLLAGEPHDVGAAHVVLILPDDVVTYDGTGMAEAGWSVVIRPDGVEARIPDVPAGAGATLLAVFDVDRTAVRQGRWEWNLDRQRQFFPALVAGGLFILVIGGGVLGQLRLQYPPVRPGTDEERRRASMADRQMLARGLRISAFVSFPFAAAGALAGYLWLNDLGPAVQAIPASVAAVALMFLIAAWAYGRRR